MSDVILTLFAFFGHGLHWQSTIRTNDRNIVKNYHDSNYRPSKGLFLDWRKRRTVSKSLEKNRSKPYNGLLMVFCWFVKSSSF